METLLLWSWGWPADSRAVGKGAESFLSGDTGTGSGLPLFCHCQPLALGADVTPFKNPGETKRAGASALCNQAAEAGIRELDLGMSQEAFWERHVDTLGQGCVCLRPSSGLFVPFKTQAHRLVKGAKALISQTIHFFFFFFLS